MIAKSYILKNLTEINSLYNKSTSHKQALYYSKLAILELCGWVEETMDDIVQGCANKRLKDSKNYDFVKELIKQTHGFHYQDDFRKMLIQMLGIINLERIEHNLNPIKFHLMKSSLGTLKQRRNEQAHTHIRDTTMTIDAPSVTRKHFQYVYAGLKDIESRIRQMK